MTFKLAEVRDTSAGLLALLDENDVSVGHGVCALFAAIGTLLPSKQLSDEEEIAWIKNAMEWSGMYFAEGMKN